MSGHIKTVRQRLDAAQSSLAGTDDVLDELVARFGPADVGRPRPLSQRFENLTRAVAYQQLSGAAAGTIWGRVLAAADDDISPEVLLALGADRLRDCGLSRAKVRAILDLSEQVATGSVRLGRFGSMDDAAIVGHLTSVWGIGEWTAQMFLMFSLGRLDVWPTGDVGVRNGYAEAWGLSDVPPAEDFEAFGDRFSGARSLVAWYCWEVADGASPQEGSSGWSK